MRLLVLVLLLLETVYSSSKYSWPTVCEEHNLSSGNGSTTTEDDEKGAKCTIYFTQYTSKEERPSFCRAMFPDFYESSKWDTKSERTVCNYRRYYQCNPDQFLIKDKCYKLYDGKAVKGWKGVENACKKDGATAAENFKSELNYIIWLYNPMASGLKTVWYNSTSQVTLYRGINSEGRLEIPGEMKKLHQPDATSMPFYCTSEARHLRSWYYHTCRIMHDTLRLDAHYEDGRCFFASPSVHVASKHNEDDKKAIQHLIDGCKWFSDDDEATAPNMELKLNGMVKLREHSPSKMTTNAYLLTPSMHDGKTYKYYFSLANIYEPFANHNQRWCKGHPQTGIALTANNDWQHLRLDSLVLGLKSDFNNRMLAIPGYFRGHQTCTNGLKQSDIPFENCKAVFGNEWEDALRDDGSVMCVKLETKVPGCSYGGMVKACQKYGATVAPIASQEEQNAIMRILDSLSTTTVTSFGIWIGAQKMEPYNASGNAARYRWDYDGKEVYFFNWDNKGSEPNNAQHNEPEANNVKDEKCIYVNRDGTWWDHHCEGSKTTGGYYCKGTTDGFCAKPLKKTTKSKPK